MTNNMGFTIQSGKRPIYICSDSQGTVGKTEKYNVQKLYVHGNNIYVGTGNYMRLIEVRKALDDIVPDLDAEAVAKHMIKIGKSTNWDTKSEDDMLRITLAGLKDGEPALYHVFVSGYENHEPSYFKKEEIFDGSGRSKTIPSITRDFETGNIYIPDITEGMNFCFSLGAKAGEDLFVDDNLQIGLVDETGAHILYHPLVNLGRAVGIHDYLAYFGTNFGIKIDDDRITSGEYNEMGEIKALMNDLYNALQSSCSSMQIYDFHVNNSNTKSKVIEGRRQQYEKLRQEHLEQRDLFKSSTKCLVDAWVSKDAKKMENALINFNGGRKIRYKNATKFEEALRRGRYPIQPELPYN